MLKRDARDSRKFFLVAQMEKANSQLLGHSWYNKEEFQSVRNCVMKNDLFFKSSIHSLATPRVVLIKYSQSSVLLVCAVVVDLVVMAKS